MCFSAPASFLAAGITGSIGVACLATTCAPRDWALAVIPLLFAVQQVVEGLLWLTLPVAPHEAEGSLLTLVFLLYAKVFWPVYAPLTVLLIEPDARRRAVMRVILLGGVAISLYLLRAIFAVDREAAILGGHIVYGTQLDLPVSVAVMYLLVTCAAPLLSSHPAVRLLGGIVIAGALISFIFYWQSFTSVWCFFAAVASAVIFLHFAHEARLQARLHPE